MSQCTQYFWENSIITSIYDLSSNDGFVSRGPHWFIGLIVVCEYYEWSYHLHLAMSSHELASKECRLPFIRLSFSWDILIIIIILTVMCQSISPEFWETNILNKKCTLHVFMFSQTAIFLCRKTCFCRLLVDGDFLFLWRQPESRSPLIISFVST